jgi:hypothetical protein
MGQDRNHPSAPGADREVAALAAAVAATRRRVADGMPVDLPMLAALAALAETTSQRACGHDANMALVGLLDELDLLVGELGQQRAVLLEQLRAMSRHSRAQGAYGNRSIGR